MQIVCLALLLYSFVLLAYVVLSYVPRPPEPMMPAIRLVRGLVDPILVPLRGVIPSVPIGGVRLDLSIIIVFVVVWILQAAVC